MEVEMLRDAGAQPAISLKASVQHQYQAEEKELGYAETEVVELGIAELDV